MATMKGAGRLPVLVLAVLVMACGPTEPMGLAGYPPSDGGPAPPLCTRPEDGLHALFRVQDGFFHAKINNPRGIQQALALRRGESSASIPNGVLLCEPVSWNCAHGWHLDPDTIEFADITIEVCDGTPSMVDARCDTFGAGRYCPWSSELVELWDCRREGPCEPIPAGDVANSGPS